MIDDDDNFPFYISTLAFLCFMLLMLYWLHV